MHSAGPARAAHVAGYSYQDAGLSFGQAFHGRPVRLCERRPPLVDERRHVGSADRASAFRDPEDVPRVAEQNVKPFGAGAVSQRHCNTGRGKAFSAPHPSPADSQRPGLLRNRSYRRPLPAYSPHVRSSRYFGKAPASYSNRPFILGLLAPRALAPPISPRNSCAGPIECSD